MKNRVLSVIGAIMLLIICTLSTVEARDPVFPEDCPEIHVGESKSASLYMWSSNDVFYKFVPEHTGYYKVAMTSPGQEIVWTPDKKQIRVAVDDMYVSYYRLEKDKTYYIEMYCNSSSLKTIKMTLTTADFLTLTDSTPITVTTNSSDDGLFEFVPEHDGLYRFEITVPDESFSSSVTIYPEVGYLAWTQKRYNRRHFATLVPLEKGKTYCGDFGCGAKEDTIVNIVARPETITPLTLSDTHRGRLTHAEDFVMLSFTPTADGFYKGVYSGCNAPCLYNSGFGIIYSDWSSSTNDLYGYEPRFLEAGKTYHYLLDFWTREEFDYSFTVEKATPENLSLSASSQITLSPYEHKLYKFVPAYDGVYNFTIGSTVCDGTSAKSTVVLYDKDFKKIVSSQSYAEKKLDAGETYYYTLHPGSYTKENTITYSFMGEQIVPISENAELTAEITTPGEFKYYKFTPSYAGGAVYHVSVSGTSTPKVEVCDKNLTASITKTSGFTFEQSAKDGEYTILKVGFSDAQQTGSVKLTLSCHELIHLEKGVEYTTNITKPGDYRYFYYDGYDYNDGVVVFEAYGDFTSTITGMSSSSGDYYAQSAESKLVSQTKNKYFMVDPASADSTGEMKVKVTSSPCHYVSESFDTTTIEIKNPGDCAWVDYSADDTYPDEVFSLISEGSCDTYVEAYRYGTNGLEYAESDDNSGWRNNFSIGVTNNSLFCVKLKDGATGTFDVRLSSTSSKTITLGRKNTVPCTTPGDTITYSSFTYTPAKSGLYQLTKYEKPEICLVTTCEVYNPDGKEIANFNHQLYLQANKEYLFRCYADCDKSDTTSYFILKKITDKNLGALPLDEKLTPDLASGTTGYYTYTATADETLYLITPGGGSDCLGHYDVYDSHWTYINSDTHETYPLIAGEKYVITCTDSVYAKILQTADNTTVNTSDVADLRSGYYENNMDKSWIYTAPEGTLYNEVTFAAETVIGDDNFRNDDDYLYIYDDDGNEVGKYTGFSLQGKTIIVKGDTFRLRLVTNSSWINSGFYVTDVKNFTAVPAPGASIPSGTIKPSEVTLSGISVADIYYKIDTASSEGEYTKYSEPFEIVETCTLTVYAEINGTNSETVSYQYKIDTKPIAEPVITEAKQSNGYITLTATAAEGKIYYRYLGSNTIYEYKSPITLTYSAVIEFYAQLGIVKSKTVTCRYEINPTNLTYAIPKPDIAVNPVLGGYEVTVSVPDGVTLCDRDDSVNYADDHPEPLCGNSDYGFTHTSGEWIYSIDWTELSVYVRGISGKTTGDYCTDSSELPKRYKVTETAYVTADIERYYENSSGTWSYTTSNYEVMHSTNRIYDEKYEQSKESFVFIEVPKAATPVITTAADKLYITAQDDSQVYYSINDGEPTVYTVPVPVNSGDVIRAYAIDYGVGMSDAAEHTYIGEVYTSSSMKHEILGSEAGFGMSEGILSGSVDVLNTEKELTNAIVLLAAYDKETDHFITMSQVPVESASDITKLDDIQLPGLEGREFYVKAFLWEDMDSMKPISIAKTVYQTPDADVSANADVSVVTLTSPKEISGEVFVALYDADNRLLEVDVQPAASAVYPQLTEADNAAYAKIMWWDMDSVEPVCAPETKSLQ